ncbi:MAG: class I tRNA ligase family protein, partial [Anaerolineales bacterium]|nr:class I tRNA ligase family protein [Anaerolineales bacterium]
KAEQDREGDCPEEVCRDLRRKVHVTLQQVSEDYQNFEFNTVISALMELLNEMNDAVQEGAVGTSAWSEAEDYYLRMLAPAAPHISEELWTRILDKPYSIHQQPWPEVDEEATKKETFTLIIQVNGKLRDRIQVPVGISDQEMEKVALESEGAASYLEGSEVKKVIVVPGRLVNIVI